jgi:hypothetical protein
MRGAGMFLVWSVGCSGKEIVPETALPRMRPVAQDFSCQPDHTGCGVDHV